MTLTSSIVLRTKRVRRRAPSGTPKWLLVTVEVLVPVALIAIWWVVSARSTDTFFPPLQVILERLVELSQTQAFWVNVGSSLGNLFLSFILATVIGIAVGTALGMSRVLSWLVEPTLHFFRAIPPVALVPIFVSLFGFGNETRVLAITLSAVFPVLIATIDGIRGTDEVRESVGRVYHLAPSDRIFAVALPAASPRILAGMQVSLIAAFVVMIASEMLGASTGLGLSLIHI